MAIQLDHLILTVNDREQSVAFYTRILGLLHEGERPPFSVIRVTPDLVLQLAPWGASGAAHLAFAMDRAEFDAAFERIRAAGVPYGDSFHSVGSRRGPGREAGARGLGPTLYCSDPSGHLIEIRHYSREECPK